MDKKLEETIQYGNPSDCNGKDVIVIITGNPGVPEFYVEFASDLHTYTELPVCIIGNCGLNKLKPAEDQETNKGDENRFGLTCQLQHKLDILKTIDKKSNIHLIGHSIGGWMVIEMVEKDPGLMNRILTVNLLFPTLQRMAETKNGFVVNKILRNIHFLLLLAYAIINLIPDVVEEFLIHIYLRLFSLPYHYTNRIKTFLSPTVGHQVLLLAYEEMDRVINLNANGLNKIKHVTNVIYSTRDGWVPVSYMDDLKKYEPEITLKKVDIDHSFVLNASEQVAEMVTQFIKSRKTKLT